MIQRVHATTETTESRRSNRRLSPLVLASALLLVAAFAETRGESSDPQAMVQPVNLAGLSRRAAVIVRGRVVEARYEPLPGYPHLQTVRVTLEVEQMLRGPSGSRYTFREFLFSHAARGKPRYVVGARLLLFLPKPSQYGLSSPLGREQGRFHIQRDAGGRDWVINGFGNAGLFRGVAEEALRDGVRLNDEELNLLQERRGPVPLERLVSIVESFAQSPEN